jgi:hypothetical protein
VRRAILVHAGPEKTEVEFLSGDGPIKFNEARIRNVVKVHNERLAKLANDYGGEDKIPMGAYEPILDSHSDASNDCVIGRLTGALKYEVRDIPKVGKNVPCAVADPGITFLGKETVVRVKDGRIFNLSIGITEIDDSLGELSTVVQPAAPGASLLNKGKKKDHGGSKMSVDVKRMKAHQERLTKMKSLSLEASSAVKKLEAQQEMIKLTAKTQKITHRLSALAKSGRIGRAEFKNFMETKLTKLSAMGDSELEVTLSILDGIQPDTSRTRMSGQVGSTSAEDVMQFGKSAIEQKNKDEYRRLAAETKHDMIKMAGGRRLFGDKEDPDKVEHSHEMKHKMGSGPVEEKVNPGKDEHVVPGQAGEKELSAHLGAMKKHLDEGDMEGAKKAYAEMAAYCAQDKKEMSEFSGDVKSEDSQAQMGSVQKELDEVKTQMSRMAGMIQEMMGTEEEEGKHFGEISKEHEEVAS